MREKIRSNWGYPCEPQPQSQTCVYKNAELVIEFGILNDGRVQFVDLRQSSGMSLYDNYAANAVKLSSPFPEIPHDTVPPATDGTGMPILAKFRYCLADTQPPWMPFSAGANRSCVDGAVADRIAAVVNGEAIMLSEVNEWIAAHGYKNREGTGTPTEKVERQALNQMIDTRLQVQEAERAGIAIADIEIETELSEGMKRIKVGRRDELEALLKSRGSGLETIRKRIRDYLLQRRIVARKVRLRIFVTEAEVDEYLEQAEARGSLNGEVRVVRQQIRDILFRRKFDARLGAWLSEMKQGAVIEMQIK